MPTRNPQAVRQRAAEATRHRSGQRATPGLDPVFVALNHGEFATQARSSGELAERVRCAEDYAVLGARVVVELHSESHAAKPSARAWAITRRAQRAQHRHQDREQRGERHRAGRAERTSRPRAGPADRGTARPVRGAARRRPGRGARAGGQDRAVHPGGWHQDLGPHAVGAAAPAARLRPTPGRLPRPPAEPSRRGIANPVDCGRLWHGAGGIRTRRHANFALQGRGGGPSMTCAFLSPTVTARARRGPAVSGVVRTQRGPAGPHPLGHRLGLDILPTGHAAHGLGDVCSFAFGLLEVQAAPGDAAIADAEDRHPALL
jgi:hypothetical protein